MSSIVHLLKVSAIVTRNYVYIVNDLQTREAVIIDPVWDKKGIELIIEKNKLIPVAVLLTHSHPDHIHLAPAMAQQYHCPVFMSYEELTNYNYFCPNLTPAFHARQIQLGSLLITPLLTPGHTSGGMCFGIDDNLFTGDTLFIEGCGICWGKGADPAAMFKSLQMLKQKVAPETKIYPAHCYGTAPGITFKEVLKYNIYLDFKTEEAFIKYRMRENQKHLFQFK